MQVNGLPWTVLTFAKSPWPFRKTRHHIHHQLESAASDFPSPANEQRCHHPRSAHLPHPIRMGVGIGIGGWTFPLWRGTFFPAGLPYVQELSFASRALTAIEVNGTYYSTQTPATFAKWRGEVPGDFVFALKAPR